MVNQSELYFRKVGRKEDNLQDKLTPNTIIKRAIFSNNKIIFIEEHKDNNDGKEYYLRVITEVNHQLQPFTCKINSEPYDVTEDSNCIIIVGNNIIELYNFNQNNNGQIVKLSEIILDQNNNNNDDISKILCIGKTNKNFICGHSSGHISKWVTKQASPFLENVKKARIHLDSINKILFDTIENREDIISCSNDKTLKVHSLDDFVCIKILDFKEEVMDVKKVINRNNQANYFINLKLGSIILYDSSFNKLVEVYNKSKIDREFICLSYSDNNDNNNNNINFNNNNDANNNINNVNNNDNNINNDNNNINSINIISDDNNNSKKINVLITEGNKIHIYDWVKKKQKNNNNNNNYDYNNYYNNNNNYNYNNNYNNNYGNYNYNNGFNNNYYNNNRYPKNNRGYY